MSAAESIPDAPADLLDPRVRTVWRLTALLTSVVVMVAALGVAMVLNWWGVSPALLVPALVVLLSGCAATALWLPDLQYRRWRYALRAEEVELQRGIATITRTVIPMARVQHVDTRRGPLDRRFGLAGLVVYTAAGSSTIPGLAEATAGRLRDRIAALANTRDDL